MMECGSFVHFATFNEGFSSFSFPVDIIPFGFEIKNYDSECIFFFSHIYAICRPN